MPSTRTSSGDERVAAILSDPEKYFAAATARAQVLAAAEVEVNLAARAYDRRTRGRSNETTRPVPWLAVELAQDRQP